MMTTDVHPGQAAMQHEPPAEKMPGHWLLARMGKRVLRPGGLELTRRLLARLAISPEDDVVEFAPGLGITARLALARHPQSYTAVERDRAAAAVVERYLLKPRRLCIRGTAEETGLPNASATVVYGEAMLSMQPAGAKQRIIVEASRLLKPGGRYGIHELCLVPDDVDEPTREAIQRDLSDEIHVGVRPLTICEWRELLESAGLTVVAEETAPMHLMEPARLIRDEGLFRAIRFAWNVAWHTAARRRVLAMRRIFRKYARHLAAVALVAEKRELSRSIRADSPNHAKLAKAAYR
ncbi:MAG TPA: methyltransferase domain-containing protein [Lacipirellulaceae bacterium]|nr:methyltransferase domain-containing protein [Lacipirellulaceae bacterium]